jgi:hypothetical protein
MAEQPNPALAGLFCDFDIFFVEQKGNPRRYLLGTAVKRAHGIHPPFAYF